MTCADIQELLSPLIDGALHDDLRRQVKTHLGKCSACDDRARQLEDVRSLLRTFEEGQEETGFAPSIGKHVLESLHQRRVGLPGPGFWTLVGLAIILGGAVFAVRVRSRFGERISTETVKFVRFERKPKPSGASEIEVGHLEAMSEDANLLEELKALFQDYRSKVTFQEEAFKIVIDYEGEVNEETNGIGERLQEFYRKNRRCFSSWSARITRKSSRGRRGQEDR